MKKEIKVSQEKIEREWKCLLNSPGYFGSGDCAEYRLGCLHVLSNLGLISSDVRNDIFNKILEIDWTIKGK